MIIAIFVLTFRSLIRGQVLRPHQLLYIDNDTFSKRFGNIANLNKAHKNIK